MILSEPLINQLARRLNKPRAEIGRELAVLARLIREQTKRDGRVRVPHMGVFHNDEGVLRFEPTEALAAAVNYRYQGLEAVVIPPSPPAAFEEDDVAESASVATAANVPEAPLGAVDVQQEEAFEVDLLKPAANSATPEIDGMLPSEAHGAKEMHAAPPEPAPVAQTRPAPPDRPPTPAIRVKRNTEKRSNLVPVLFALLFLLAAAAAVFYLVYDGSVLQVKQAIYGAEARPSAAQPLQPGTPAAPLPTADSLAASTSLIADTTWTIVAASRPDSLAASQFATALRQQLEATALPVSIVASAVEGEMRYRVSLGRYASEAEADSAIARLGNTLPADAWTLALTMTDDQ